MSDMKYVCYADTPAQTVEQIKSHIRRMMNMAGETRLRRHALENVMQFLNHLHVEPIAEMPHIKRASDND